MKSNIIVSVRVTKQLPQIRITLAAEMKLCRQEKYNFLGSVVNH
jgi:hypothetical protein